MISVSLLSTMVFLFAANKYNHCSSEYPASEPHFSKNELIFRAQEDARKLFYMIHASYFFRK